MPVPLTDQNRQKLARLLGMLGSEHSGEVINAAALAERLRKAAGLTWTDILAPSNLNGAAAAVLRAEQFGFERGHAAGYAEAVRDLQQRRPAAQQMGWWRKEAQDLLNDYEDTISTWEEGFLTSIAARVRPLTERQTEVLEQIIQKYRG